MLTNTTQAAYFAALMMVETNSAAAVGQKMGLRAGTVR